MISNRIKKILEIILQTTGSVNIAYISEQIGVSERTIYRELSEVTDILEKHNLTLNTVSKKGIKVEGDSEDRDTLLKEISSSNDVYVADPEERADVILFDLLLQEDYIKADAIAIDNGISTPTVRNDLKKLKKQLERTDLSLTMKKGDGIQVQGNQVDKNHYLCNIIMRYLEKNIILEWLEGKKVSQPFLNKIEDLGFWEVFQQCHKIIREIHYKPEEQRVKLNDQEYMEVVFLLSMMVIWNQKGMAYTKAFAYKVDKENQIVAEEIAGALENFFSIELSKLEREYIEVILNNATVYNTSDFYNVRNQQMDEKFRQFVTYIEEHLGIYIIKDKDFRESLYIHIDKAVSRVRSGMSITNPLLSEVRKDYKELFGIVRDAVTEIFPANFFPDDEIAYIVMYFAVALDKTMKKTFRILIVCSGGMGSSKMLAHRIEQEIPEIAVKKTVSLLDFTRENLNDYDLIIATIPLYIDKDQYMRVSPALNDSELNQVREQIKRHKYKTLRKITVQEKEKRRMESGGDIHAISQMKEVLEISLEMISDFQILTKKESKNPNDDLEYILEEAKEFEIKKELDRVQEEKKYFQIPTTDLLYYEMKHGCDVKPKIYVCHFSETQYLEGKEAYHNVIYVLYSNKAKGYERDLLNHLVGAIVDDMDLQKMITDGNEEGIKQWIGYQIKQYTAQLFST